MALSLDWREDDEVTLFLNTVLDAYKNGWCDRDDARGTLWEVLDAAVKQNPNFISAVRAFTRLHMRD